MTKHVKFSFQAETAPGLDSQENGYVDGSQASNNDVQSLGLPQNASEMLAQMCYMYRYELGDLESFLWQTQVLDVYPDEQIVRAMLAHIEGPAPDRKFMPKYGDIKNMIAPATGLLEIEALVRSGNPYSAPQVKDPVLVQAITLMGGWEAVCAQMPDARERPIDFSQYCKRMESALAQARQQVQVHGVSPAPLKGLADAQRSTLRLANSGQAVPALSAPELPGAEPAQLTGVFDEFARRVEKSYEG